VNKSIFGAIFGVRASSGDGGPGFIEATLFEFPATAAGAGVVAAGFGVGAAKGLLGNLCIFVHEIGILDGFWEIRGGTALLGGGRQGVAEDEDGGAETGGSGGRMKHAQRVHSDR
jgi:hypothetical protein